VGRITNTKKIGGKRMKFRRSSALLATVLALALVSVALVQANKPLRFEVSGEPATDFTGWEGTVDSGPFEGMTICWYQPVIEPKGTTVYFFEIWWIEDGDEKVLLGYDEGVTRLKNGKFSGNGKVIYAAEGYEHLMGLKEKCEGQVDFLTITFTGSIQIN
jgi:hypothetical protein